MRVVVTGFDVLDASTSHWILTQSWKPAGVLRATGLSIGRREGGVDDLLRIGWAPAQKIVLALERNLHSAETPAQTRGTSSPQSLAPVCDAVDHVRTIV